ncbi:MAG: hypothetical protein AAFX45_12635 [Pseudomonadota bacterium]
MKQVVITINGPGEISAWLRPLAAAIKAGDPDVRIFVCLLPCVYSSGSEKAVLDAIAHVDAAASVGDSLKLIAFRTFPAGLDADADTLVVRLGGDMVLSSWLARRIKAPAFGYTERPNPVLKRFDRIFYTGLNPMPDTIGGRATEYLGEMMVDAAFAKRGGLEAPDVDAKVIGVFPGSRSYMAEFMLPYYAPAIDMVAADRPDVRWLMARSDFVTDDWLRAFPAPPDTRNWTAGPVTFHEEAGAQWFTTPAGTKVEVRPNAEVFRQMKAALTIPGTNTGEMAAAGIPMVTVLPTYRYVAEHVPLRGLSGHVSRLPWIGMKLKIMATQAVLRNPGFLSQANRRAGRFIVPELIGQNLHGDIAQALKDQLDDTEGATGREIQSIMGAPGTADRFADEVIAHFQAHAAAA